MATDSSFGSLAAFVEFVRRLQQSEEVLLLQLSDASRHTFLGHIVCKIGFLVDAPHLQQTREPLELPGGIADPPLGQSNGSFRDPPVKLPGTSWPRT